MAGNTQFLLDTNILLAALITPDSLPTDVQTTERPGQRHPVQCLQHLGNCHQAPPWPGKLQFQAGGYPAIGAGNGLHRITDLVESLPPDIRSAPWHHRDPFDRLLVSQAQAIPAYLLTTDELLAKYSELVRVVMLR